MATKPRPVFAHGAWGREATVGVLYPSAKVDDRSDHNRVIILELVPTGSMARIYFDDRSDTVIAAARNVVEASRHGSQPLTLTRIQELEQALDAFDKPEEE